MEDRLTAIEDKLGGMAEALEGLPDLISKSLGRGQSASGGGERNLLRPESAALALTTTSAMPHSKSVPTSASAGIAKTLLPPPLPPRTTNT